MIGQKLYQARLMSGLTQKDVVNRLAEIGYSITNAVISKYELNKSTPPPSLIIALSNVLNVSPSYFLHIPQVNIDWVAYRKHTKLPKQVQEEIQGYAHDVVDLQMELRQLLYPQDTTPFPEPRILNNIDETEQLAEELRDSWGLDNLPIDNLTHIAETRGVIIINWVKSDGNFGGLSGWSNNTPISIINTTVSNDRRRFSLAHELGHLLMKVNVQNGEKFANRFAGAFLVPQDVAYHELGRKRHDITLSEFGLLKKRYGLSIAGWIFRAKDLGIISTNLASNLWRELSQRGWRQIEPVEYTYGSNETPILLEQMCLRAVSEQLITITRIQQVLPNFRVEEEIMLKTEFPLPSELIAMSEEERQKWMDLSFELAKNMEFEQFDAFGEEYF